ncbi:APH domain protein [Rhizoctonia solani AG-3 Rhs1AP]|uniref:APH domain protein n=1 Tax=Rhizoctonia solani AG-3 Rhs1AP TaxID=1086054 RepID=X8JQD9_9AGAM|nr:APH domain protein [Rhizoctonia solani AG-3 Rhs1AP]
MAATSAPLTHDFTPALVALDPYHQYFTSPLSGGLINFTVRVNISAATEEHKCPFGGARSVVAKYAPAFVASMGESAPFSQYRQVIEARALALLSQPSISAYIQSSNVTFPKLVHHDQEMHTLIMSDLGETNNLDKWLMSGPGTDVAVEVGKSFGEFLAKLGSISESIDQVAGNPLSLCEHFDNASIHNLIFDYAIAPVEAHLLRCGYDPVDAAFVGKLCISMHERQQARLKQLQDGVFGIGDSWPRSFLVGGVGSKLQLSVVDWEFAGMISPLVDLAQLCAHLYLLCRTSSTKFKARSKACTLAMVHAHHTYAPQWHYQEEYRADAWALFGREIIINTIEMNWWDGDEVKKQADMHSFGAHGAKFIKEAKQRGSQAGPLFDEIFSVL